MALQVWLPLHRDLTNYGIQSLPTAGVNTLTVQDNGKIGKCYKGCCIYPFTHEFLNNSWTISLWVKCGGSWGQYNDILLCKNVGSSDSCQFYMSIVGGNTFNIGVNGGSGTTSYSYTFDTSSWYHLCCSYSGSKIKMYLNGSLVKSYDTTLSQKEEHYNLGIGCRSNNDAGTSSTGAGSHYLNDVRIYDEALSDREVLEIAKARLLHYPLNETIDGTTISDVSGLCNHGTIGSDYSPTLDTETESARYDHCYDFTSAQYINCGQGGKVSDAITVSVWAYMDTWTNNIRLCSCTESGGWNFEPNSNCISFPLYVTSVGYVTAKSSRTWASLTSGWHLFTGTFDGLNVKLYIDGVIDSTTSTGQSSRLTIGYNSTNSLFIHAEATDSATTPSTGYAAMKMSDFRVYGTALSASDIKELYNTPISITDNGTMMTQGEFIEE